MIPYGRQTIDSDDLASVIEVLQSDWLTQGPAIERFEDMVRERVEADFAVAFSSGTAALHAAAWASGISSDDIVYTSPLTFMASANAARYLGAKPGLVDIEESTLNIDIGKIPREADALIPVHFCGLPVDMQRMRESSAARVIIEDAAHALGASSPDGPVGNCSNSDATCFSFHPVKPITTGEGGMVTTNNEDLADRLRRFRTHGIVRRPEIAPWHYEITDLGFNYRMTDIQAALGISQLEKLDRFIQKRTEIAERYRAAFKDIPAIRVQAPAPEGFRHGYHLFTIRVPNREKVFRALQRAGIGVQVHYVPIHHHPISKDAVLPDEGLPVVDQEFEQLISLPIFPSLSPQDQDRVISLLRETLDAEQ